LPEKSAKKSRTTGALLFLVFLVALFVAVAAIFSIFSDKQEEGAGWSEFLIPADKVAVIEVEGTITTSDRILKQLRKLSRKSSVKAIVLRINSPGGAVAPAQEIYREIGKVKRKKPVVASIETVGASAAYYIASAADRIVCSRGTITGSIGVIMVMAEIEKIIDKLGVKVNVIKAGKFKDIGSGVRPLTDEERGLLESFAKEIHEQFIKDVEAGRHGKIDMDKLRSIADGSFFTGEKAKDLGLVDTIGNFYDAVKIAGELGGIEGEPKLIYPKKKWDSYLDLFFESFAQSVAKALERTRVMDTAPAVR
jgi:protease-4